MSTENLKTQSRKLKLGSFRELGLLVFIVVISLIIQTLNKEFFTFGAISDLLNNTAILIILSMGMLVVMLTGGIDLSIGSNMALTGMIAAQFISRNPQFHSVVAILIGMLLGLACGVIIGLLISQLKILPIIASLGMNYIFRGITFMVSDGSWISAHQFPEHFKKLGTGTLANISYLVWIALIIILISWYFLSSTRTGRKIYATGSNFEAVTVSGINARSIQLLAYSIMGALAGLAGVLWVAKFASAQPDTAIGYEVNVIAACVMGGVSVNGGRGEVPSVVLGALLIGIINNAIPMLSAYLSTFWQDLIKGCIILLAILINVIVKRRNDYRALQRREI